MSFIQEFYENCNAASFQIASRNHLSIFGNQTLVHTRLGPTFLKLMEGRKQKTGKKYKSEGEINK